MESKTTKELMDILEQVHSEADLDRFIENERMSSFKSFREYLLSLEKFSQQKLAEIVRNSLQKREYAYEILSLSSTKKPGRDRLLSICIAAGLDLNETQRCLEIEQIAGLYVRNERDAVIIFGINHQKSVSEINDLLTARNFPQLEGTGE